MTSAYEPPAQLGFLEWAWPVSAEHWLEENFRAFLQVQREFEASPGDPEAVLEGLEALSRLEQEYVPRAMRLLVSEARAHGVSWTVIGQALGVGRTAAQKRFGPELRMNKRRKRLR
jgi:hypothetical protein